MKPGDLVVLTEDLGIELLSTDPYSNPHSNSWQTAGITFKNSEIGTILEIKQILNKSDQIVKVIVPQGIGWCFTDWLKVV